MCEYITIYLFSAVGIWVVSSLGRLWIKMLWTFIYMSSGGLMHSLLWVSGVKFLSPSHIAAFSRYCWTSFQSECLILYSHCYWVKAWTACHMTSNKLSNKELDKKSNFIRKASEQRRWQTSVLKNHLEKAQNSGFFFNVRGEGNGKWLKSGGDRWPQSSGHHQG